jgi:hypothetical protein
VDTVERAEATEKDLDRLIEKRAAVEDPEAKEALWLRSVERYNARRRDQNRWEWVRYHEGQAERIERTAAMLAAEHRAMAIALMDEGAA